MICKKCKAVNETKTTLVAPLVVDGVTLVVDCRICNNCHAVMDVEYDQPPAPEPATPMGRPQWQDLNHRLAVVEGRMGLTYAKPPITVFDQAMRLTSVGWLGKARDVELTHAATGVKVRITGDHSMSVDPWIDALNTQSFRNYRVVITEVPR